MTALRDILGVLICLSPILAIVIYLAWATRRHRCAQCHQVTRNTTGTCEHCGQPLERDQK
jgi:rRNA maturation endonuclease Nob1